MGSYAVQNAVLGCAMLGACGGVVGSFALLRRQSLLGDALAHAALPGVCVAFLLSGAKSTSALLAGALVAGLLGAFVILGVVRGSAVKEDGAIGIVLSVFFGLGIVLLTWVQRSPGAHASGLDRFLFGQAASLTAADVRIVAIVAVLACAFVAVAFKEFAVVSFDRAFGAAVGLPVAKVEVALTALLVVVVVVGLQMVGVVLTVATLLTPAAAARQWTDRLGVMLVAAGAIGAFSGALGAWVSAVAVGVATGPAVVLVATVCLVASLALAPERGLLGAAARHLSLRERVRRENLVRDLWLLAERGGGFERFTSLASLTATRGQRRSQVARLARRLARAGWVERVEDTVRLTEVGRDAAASIVRKHRLWETYLATRLDLPADQVHRDAETMEHFLDERAVDDLDRLLAHPGTDPHGREIPRPERSGA